MFVFGTADDVFSMAIRIKENGRTFYAGAAKGTEDPVLKKLFEDLAEMEDAHIKFVKHLRAEYPSAFPEGKVWDPEELATSYLKAAADTHVFTQEAVKERMKEIRTAPQALDAAIEFEKDSVHFFLGLKEILPDPKERNELDDLIKDEMNRISKLAQARMTCDPTACEIVS